MDQWNYGRISQQEGGYTSVPYGAQQGASAYGPAQYGHSEPSYGQAYGQQILGKANDYQGPAGVGVGTSMDVYPNTGYGGASVSTAAFTQKNDSLKRYSDSQLDQQTIQQQHLLQSTLRHGVRPSALDTIVRSQREYTSASVGRNPTLPIAVGGNYGGGKELLGSSYVARPETEVALLGSQSSITSRGGIGVSQFHSSAIEPSGPLVAGRGILGYSYPSAYGSLEARSGLSDFSGIVSAHYEDILDDQMLLRIDYKRWEDGWVREREHDRLRDLDMERSRERERERQREKERALQRERHERERAREKELWDRGRDLRRWERSPPQAAAPPPRSDEKMIRKVSPRFWSPITQRRQEYVCKVDPFSLVEVERDLLCLIRRYPRLFVAADFSKAVACWREVTSGISLNHPISFEIDAVDAGGENRTKEGAATTSEETNATMKSITWTVKVMLMSGANGDDLRELISDSGDRPLHMHNVLKFVVLRKERSALMALGGTWDKVLDGGDPATDENALIQTAIRCTRNATHLDLHGVKSWTRFMEIHYDRMGENNLTNKEIAVFLIPDLSGIIPSFEDWKLKWKEKKDIKAELSHKGSGTATNIGSVQANYESGLTDVKTECENIKQELKLEKVEDVNKESKKEVDKMEDVKDEERKQLEKRCRDEKVSKQEDKGEMKEDDKNHDCKKDYKTKVYRKDKGEIDEEREDCDVKSKTSDKKSRSGLEEGVPATPGFFITMKRGKSARIRAMTISLDGLLDYDERDKEESTFELSLFAEFFQEMLQYKFGCKILDAIEVLHPLVQAMQKDERKRVRENNKDSSQSTNKKSKFSEKISRDADTDAPYKFVETKRGVMVEDVQNVDKMDENDGQKHDKDIDVAMQDASLINLVELQEESQNISEVASRGVEAEIVQSENVAARREEEYTSNEELLQAFRYFDRNRVGYLRAEDVRRLLHILGRYLTRRRVKDITSSAIIECKSKDERIYYGRLVLKEPI